MPFILQWNHKHTDAPEDFGANSPALLRSHDAHDTTVVLQFSAWASLHCSFPKAKLRRR